MDMLSRLGDMQVFQGSFQTSTVRNLYLSDTPNRGPCWSRSSIPSFYYLGLQLKMTIPFYGTDRQNVRLVQRVPKTVLRLFLRQRRTNTMAHTQDPRLRRRRWIQQQLI